MILVSDSFGEHTVKSTLVANGHPFMTGVFTPHHVECDAGDLSVIGKIPGTLDGVYLRNTQNPVHQPLGKTPRLRRRWHAAPAELQGRPLRVLQPVRADQGFHGGATGRRGTHSCWADASDIRSDWAGF